MLINYKYPKKMNKEKNFQVFINGERADIVKTNVAYFVTCAYDEAVTVEIKTSTKIDNVLIQPLRAGISADIKDTSASFIITENMFLSISLSNIKLPIYFYGNSLPDNNDADKATYYFKSGQIYETGEIILNDNETVYIEGGAVVVGSIYAGQAKNIKILGHGVLDGSYDKDSERKIMILLDECEDCYISDIILIEPTSWMIMLAGCDRIKVSAVKEIGEVMSSDGVDIVGSANIEIENCIFRNNDDCVVIKAFPANKKYPDSKWDKNVKNINVSGCIFINAEGGNGIEIGHELRVCEVSDIVFRNIDILNVGGIGAPLSIHAGDRATVKNVLFEDIRIEHYYCKIFDFRVMKSQFNHDDERGRIENVICRNILLHEKIYNPGYTTSLIGGYNENHIVDGVFFEKVFINDREVKNIDELDIFTKYAKNIKLL